jgi:hypothetical protein
MILFYAAERDRVVTTLEGIMAQRMPQRHLVHCRSLALLEKRLRRPHHKVEILLLYVADAIEIRHLSAMRPLLVDIRLVIVLPDRNADIIAWAHKLSPRFIAYADDGLEQAGGVVEKMLLAQKVVALRAAQ